MHLPCNEPSSFRAGSVPSFWGSLRRIGERPMWRKKWCSCSPRSDQHLEFGVVRSLPQALKIFFCFLFFVFSFIVAIVTIVPSGIICLCSGLSFLFFFHYGFSWDEVKIHFVIILCEARCGSSIWDIFRKSSGTFSRKSPFLVFYITFLGGQTSRSILHLNFLMALHQPKPFLTPTCRRKLSTENSTQLNYRSKASMK